MITSRNREGHLMGIEDLRHKLEEATRLVHEAVDLSVELKQSGGRDEQEVNHLWEEFLGGAWGYIKKRGKESGQNLLEGISLFHLLR